MCHTQPSGDESLQSLLLFALSGHEIASHQRESVCVCVCVCVSLCSFNALAPHLL